MADKKAPTVKDALNETLDTITNLFCKPKGPSEHSTPAGTSTTDITDLQRAHPVFNPFDSSVSPLLLDSGFDSARDSKIYDYVLKNVSNEIDRREKTSAFDSGSTISSINPESVEELGKSILEKLDGDDFKTIFRPAQR